MKIFVLGQVEVNKYLFMTEFVNHLVNVHKNALIVCGHDGCCSYITSINAINHWEKKHQVYVFQCAYCKFGSNYLGNMYPHFAQNHANLTLDVLVRKNDFSVSVLWFFFQRRKVYGSSKKLDISSVE